MLFDQRYIGSATEPCRHSKADGRAREGVQACAIWHPRGYLQQSKKSLISPFILFQPIHVTQVIQQPTLSSSQIGQFEIVNIVKMSEGVKVEEPPSEAEIKNWTTLSNLCRLCAQESADVIQIFGEEGIALRLPEIISACLPITVNLLVQLLINFLTFFYCQVSREDALPQVSCRACASALQQSHILLTTVKEADNNLRKMLVHQTAETGDLPNKVCLLAR